MADTPNGNAAGGPGETVAQGENPQQFAIQKVYLKDCSVETPGAPDVFTQAWKPEARVELNTRRTTLGEGLHEVVLTVTVTATAEEKPSYLCEVHQAGIFTVNGFEDNATDQLLGAYCPGVLFPYAREAISDLTGKAGFPPMTLSPVNFDALYARQRQQDAAGASESEAGAETTNQGSDSTG
ncbi:protein-export chaperone SecB [Spiribacter insolitus]|uniref:Protein-export protein SecB n=1 Tax=Spiribacter insolitus TaxID=3122417 RepID=A0ABV3T8F2_9GAMM